MAAINKIELLQQNAGGTWELISANAVEATKTLMVRVEYTMANAGDLHISCTLNGGGGNAAMGGAGGAAGSTGESGSVMVSAENEPTPPNQPLVATTTFNNGGSQFTAGQEWTITVWTTNDIPNVSSDVVITVI